MNPPVQPPELIPSEEVVRLLEIKLPTLYAYVSRGLIRSVGGGSKKKRLYLREDVERMRARHDARSGHTAVAASALRWGEPVLDTRISQITSEGPQYRGLLAVELVERGASFEAVAELLWQVQRGAGIRPRVEAGPVSAGRSAPRPLGTRVTTPGLVSEPGGVARLRGGPGGTTVAPAHRTERAGDRRAETSRSGERSAGGARATDLGFGVTPDLPDGRPPSPGLRPLQLDWRPGVLGVPAAVLSVAAPRAASPLTAMEVTLSLLGHRDESRHGAPPSAEWLRAATLIPRLAASLALSTRRSTSQALGRPTVAACALTALGGRESRHAVEAVNAALVLLADHELNTSTFAARVAASAGADLYGCLTAGLVTAAGPKHGGAANRVEASLETIPSPKAARELVRQRYARGEELAGFGHPLYPLGDPRSLPLLERARELAPRDPAVKTAFAVVEAMRDAGHAPPAVDFALVVLCLALKLPAGSAAALFALGRTAGWVAHALEQREAGFLLRPRARYVGPSSTAATGNVSRGG